METNHHKESSLPSCYHVSGDSSIWDTVNGGGAGGGSGASSLPLNFHENFPQDSRFVNETETESVTGLQPGTDRVIPDQELTSHGSNGFDHRWLSNPKTRPTKHTRTSVSGGKKQFRGANSINGNTAALLQAKLQRMPSVAPPLPEVDLPGKNGPFEDGPEITIDKSKKSLESISSEGVQLSKMPSLDMDMIWDALVSDSLLGE
ncbi:hypothetical protein L6452_29828 [Arctium lappa]|uniref:Uncharacterized protein n=1 Tax=Arctium lappa TaxID=4217 RepID=A0ACB8ZH79_ARCLA|nr:hypothetical protein L6452_29828 [Arctium lappa]